MSDSTDGTMTTSDIARLANVDLSTVSNWRKRFQGTFPERILVGESTRPRFDRQAVERWLQMNPQLGGAPIEAPPLSLHAVVDTFRGVLSPSEAFDFIGRALALIAAMTDEQLTPELVLDRVPSWDDLSPEMFDLAGTDLWTTLPHSSVVDALGRLIAAGPPRDVYEEFLAEFQRSSAATDSTPQPLLDLMVALSPDSDGVVFDLAAGTGGTLLAALSKGKASGGEGVDIIPGYAQVARIRAYLADSRISMHSANSFTKSPLYEQKADLVLVDPPLNMMFSRDRQQLDWIDWEFGNPPATKPEWAWPQLAISHLAPGGTAIVVSGLGLLSHQDKQSSSIRNELIRRGAVRAVIALPRRLRTNTAIPLAVWVLGEPDQIDRRTTILLIDATNLNPDELGQDGPILSAYENWRAGRTGDLDRSFAIDVPVMDLLAPEATLLPNRWTIDPTETRSANDWTAALVHSYLAASESLSTIGHGLPHLQVTALKEPPAPSSIGGLEKAGSIAVLRGRHMERELEEATERYPMMTVRHVRPDTMPTGLDTEFVAASPSSTAQLVTPGEIIVYLDGQSVRARIWTESGWVLGRFMQSIRVLDSSLNPEFLAAAISAPVNEKFLAAGASRTHFTLKEFLVTQPPIEVQDTYAQAYDLVTDKLRWLRQAVDELEAAREQLAQAASSGRVAVKIEDAQ
ncbi:hypothetical protein GY21_08825 [Cryobacterium roopkundense]|uniref:DNA methylase adenine-specific domain-containing protein n=1 Tax=Cryobacterium roopkundense TaxID=1001240 RepID=A0A099JEM2_9MICO|nr:N-6 DNA methylase [Cryobacterium roopkundense]KGJ76934.1 hypothetical protein GY21_08825 [Cryobacterium roopkundense]MBB5643175.1 hypothetical protein [Cryobacterium roopkundense]